MQVVTSYTYLGYIVFNNYIDDMDIKRQARSFYAYANLLIRKFVNCNSAVKLSLFRTYCINMYCSHLWWTYSKTCMNNIRVAYNNAFRILMGFQRDCSASGMFVSNDIHTFDALRRKLIYKFSVRLHSSDNSLTLVTRNSDAFLYSTFHAIYRNVMYFQTTCIVCSLYCLVLLWGDKCLLGHLFISLK